MAAAMHEESFPPVCATATYDEETKQHWYRRAAGLLVEPILSSALQLNLRKTRAALMDLERTLLLRAASG